VATYLNINEKWSASLKDVKVGDVIQRTIKRAAGGTLSEFIPKTQWDSVNGISIYPQRAVVNTHKSKTGVSSTRTETVNYLFEKEGEVMIPGIEYIYWNSNNKKFYHKQIDSVIINVKPNADLAMLASIKNSLQKEQKNLAEEEKDSPLLIWGMTIKEFSKYLILSIFALVILIFLLKKFRTYLISNKTKRLQSETYAFKKVTKAISGNNYFEFIKQVNFWLLKLSRKPISFSEFATQYGSERLKETLNKMDKAYFKDLTICDKASFQELNKAIKESRKNYFIQQKKSKESSTDNDWLNPASIN
jgi:hypothetical protein